MFAGCLPASALALRVLPWDRDISERKLVIGIGKEIIPIGYMHPAARTAPIKIPAGAEGLRVIATDRKNEEENPAAERLVIPKGVKKPLLLILPDEKSAAGVKLLVIEDGVNSFKWGTIRLINVTPRPLVFRWGKKAMQIPTGWKPTDISPGGKSRNMEIITYLKDDLKKPLYSAVWEHRKDMRQLLFLVPNPDEALGPIAFKFIPETRIPDKG